MPEITLKTVSYDDCTIGRLWCGEFQCMTLELPWLNNAKNVSCIPAGTYRYNFRLSPKNGPVLELKAVKDRTYIQIHAGNFTSQIEGCILVGDGLKDINSDSITDVTNSKTTLKKLLDIAGDSGFITIDRVLL